MSRPQQRDSEPESLELQLPLLGLYADLEMGRGSVRMPDEVMACSSAQQIELITDWLRDLERYRDRALLGLYRQLEAGMGPDVPAEQRLERFRVTCASLGIEVPPDFEAPAAPRR